MRGKRIRKPDRWQTEDEFKFLRGIGTWCLSMTLSRKEMLENYISSAWRRDDWGELDRKAVIVYARRLLEEVA